MELVDLGEDVMIVNENGYYKAMKAARAEKRLHKLRRAVRDFRLHILSSPALRTAIMRRCAAMTEPIRSVRR